MPDARAVSANAREMALPDTLSRVCLGSCPAVSSVTTTHCPSQPRPLPTVQRGWSELTGGEGSGFGGASSLLNEALWEHSAHPGAPPLGLWSYCRSRAQTLQSQTQLLSRPQTATPHPTPPRPPPFTERDLEPPAAQGPMPRQHLKNRLTPRGSSVGMSTYFSGFKD